MLLCFQFHSCLIFQFISVWKVEFILSLVSTCRYDYVLCFHKEGKTLCWNCPFGGNRNVQVLLHQRKTILYALFVYTDHLKYAYELMKFCLCVCKCIISQSSLFSFQINITLFADNTVVYYWSCHSDDGFQDKMLCDFLAESSKHWCAVPRLSTQQKFFWYQTFASQFFRTVFQSTTSRIFLCPRAPIHFHRDCAHSVFLG